MQDRTGDEVESVQDGRILDFISGTAELKDTPKEQVRQRIARALFHEYGISVDDMEGDYSVSVGGRRRRIDIAIFRPGQPHEQHNLRRVVVCRPEPPQAKRGAVKMRDYAQAAKDIKEIKPYFHAHPGSGLVPWRYADFGKRFPPAVCSHTGFGNRSKSSAEKGLAFASKESVCVSVRRMRRLAIPSPRRSLSIRGSCQ